MAKNSIRDWSTTASDNTDIAGIGVQGTNLVSNFDNAFRTLMKQIADVDEGVQPVNDTWTFCDPVDATKKIRIDAGTVATATTRTMTFPNADVTWTTHGAIIAGLTGAAGQFIRSTGASTAVMQNMVGTVSQSGGTPTGAIVERGNNANGNYVRFADGTQIAWSSFTASGSTWKGSGLSVALPAAFTASPAVVATPIRPDVSDWSTALMTRTDTVSTFIVYGPYGVTDTGTSILAYWAAFGRWF